MEKHNIFKIVYRDVFLRDPIEEDAERYIKWNKYETEWKRWDAPWEDVEEDEVLIKEKILKIVHREKSGVRTRLQLCFIDGTHIGSVSYYKKDGKDNKIAIGIDIPEKNFWGRGIGKQALELWIAYLFIVNSNNNIYTETWSGNVRMIRLAEKLGFEEVEREVNKREVRGELYDGLAFILTKEKFIKNHEDLMEQVLYKFDKSKNVEQF